MHSRDLVRLDSPSRSRTVVRYICYAYGGATSESIQIFKKQLVQPITLITYVSSK